MHIGQRYNKTLVTLSAAETTRSKGISHKDARIFRKEGNKNAYSKRNVERYRDKQRRHRNPMTEKSERRIYTYMFGIQTDSQD